ncbi:MULTISPECIES: type II toxin-antitoxin system HicA family toxin [unclassified Frankia]|uniref:type II toxin-antitoxin system HicA family toxin n=1 Tax=unclassified Frankia TaxID=2632575 RepID=UPI001EF58957|nr:MULTISPECIES: type II toxin-antitoxin system HicA family toxin [unclassified Frankia]
MPAVPALRGAQVVKALEKAGFAVARIHGSHHIMKHEDGRRTTVPVHGGRDIRPGTLRSILRDTGLTVDDLHGLL